jgi:hypothetical protein
MPFGTLPFFHHMISFECCSQTVTTLALGSWPRQRLMKVQAKNEAQESHFMLPGVWVSVREWTFTLLSELPLWELESWWTPESLKRNYKGQNPLDWRVPYIIQKLLKRRCLNYQFDSWQLKVKNWADSLTCKWHATYRLKNLNEGYKFDSDLISIGGLYSKLWAAKVAKVSILGISKLSGQNDI